MNYMPENKAEFVEWNGNLINVSQARTAARGLLINKLTELEALYIKVKGLREKRKTASRARLGMQAKGKKRELWTFATLNLLELTLDQNEQGKRSCFAVCSESGAMKREPWSNMPNAVIP